MTQKLSKHKGSETEISKKKSLLLSVKTINALKKMSVKFEKEKKNFRLIFKYENLGLDELIKVSTSTTNMIYDSIVLKEKLIEIISLNRQYLIWALHFHLSFFFSVKKKMPVLHQHNLLFD